MKERVKITGSVSAQIRFLDGRAWQLSGQNLVTSVGENLIALLLSGAGTAPSHIACGDDNSASTLADTDLIGNELEREAAVIVVDGNTITLSCTLTGTGSDVVVGEFGIFNDPTTGDLFARWVTPQFTLPSTAEIDVSWKLTIGD